MRYMRYCYITKPSFIPDSGTTTTIYSLFRHFRVFSGPGEEYLAQKVVAASKGHAAQVDAPDLSRLAAILRSAQLVMAGDTGPLHLAHALGTRVLCIMGPTDPAKSGPYGRPDLALWKQLPCSFCYKRFDLTKACLFELTPEAVASRAEELLGLVA